MTTAPTTATAVDAFLDTIVAGRGIPIDIYAPDATLDATVPGWRFALQGPAAICAEYSRWFGHAARFEELERHTTSGGEVIAYLVTWEEQGELHAARHCHLLSVAADGRIAHGRGLVWWALGCPTAGGDGGGGVMLNGVTDLGAGPRPVADSLDELLVGATARHAMLHSDSKSGVAFERLLIDGRPHVLKCVHIDDDWTMRCFGETTCVPLEVWRTGIIDALPERIDHTVVGVAGGLGRDGLGAAVLMRDVTAALLPAGDDTVTSDQHEQLIDDMAALAARTWGWAGHEALLPFANRWLPFGEVAMADERDRGWPNEVPRIANEGWQRFSEVAPRRACEIVVDLRHDLLPLTTALAATPTSFLHGDWKMGNLGVAADGRTVLLDWTYCGAGPVCHELGWYLALNRARLPESKEATIERLRTALQHHGVDTTGWWDRQLGASLLGTLVQFGWEKAFGGPDELDWWCDRAVEGAELL